MRLRIPFISSLLHDDPAGGSTASSSASSKAHLHDEEAGRKLRDPTNAIASPTRPLLSPGEKEADADDDEYSDAFEEEPSEIEDMEIFRVGRFAFSLTLLLFGTLSVSLLTAGALLFSSFLGKTLMGAGAGLVLILVMMLLCGGERERGDGPEGEGAEGEGGAVDAERRALLLDPKPYYSPRASGAGKGARGSPQETASSNSSRRESPAAPSRLV